MVIGVSWVLKAIQGIVNFQYQCYAVVDLSFYIIIHALSFSNVEHS